MEITILQFFLCLLVNEHNENLIMLGSLVEEEIKAKKKARNVNSSAATYDPISCFLSVVATR